LEQSSPAGKQREADNSKKLCAYADSAGMQSHLSLASITLELLLWSEGGFPCAAGVADAAFRSSASEFRCGLQQPA
jgi:hypothetical protein